jgi:hypothetical protein
MFSQKKEKFSRVFYERHRNHLIRVFIKISFFLGVSGSIAAASMIAYFSGRGDLPFTSIALAVFLFLLWAAFRSIPDQLKVTVLPYFEQRLGDANTWMAGKSLLWNTRDLDQVAQRLGARPLSDFASGDDMISGEKLCWFFPNEALNTLELLLQPEICNGFSADLVSDLRRLKDALKSADSKNVKFCLILREGSFTSGLEMDRRKGSFF